MNTFEKIKINPHDFTLPMNIMGVELSYEHCSFEKSTYEADDSIYLSVYNAEDGPITDITVCLDLHNLGSNEAAIDTNNCGDSIIDFLEDNNLAKRTRLNARSGWCSYPIVEFNPEFLKEI